MNFRSPLFKYHAAGAVLLCAVLSLFISCENFLKAEVVSKEVKNFIEYSNSSSYTIKVNSKNGTGFVQSPAGGETTKKVSDVFNVTFNTDDDYEFIEWKIIDSVSKTQFNNGEYLEIDNLSQESATCTFVKAPAAGMQLSLVPVVAERPRIIDKTPAPGETNAYRDSVIQIMFDHDMSEKSLYYTQNEISELKLEYNIDDNAFLKNSSYVPDPNDPESSNYYGYTITNGTNEEQFYKIISVVDYNNGRKSLLKYFGAPTFQTTDTLVIPIGEGQLLPTNIQIYAILKKDVAYEQTKLVCQKDDTPWTFFVGNKTDDNPPEMSTDSIIKARTVSIPDEDNPLLDEPVDINFTTQIANDLPTLYDKSIYINVLVTDPDSGPASYFDMTVIDTADSTNTKTYRIYYNKVTSAKGRKYEGLYQLAGLKDGTYKISDLKFYDMKEQIIPNTNFSTQIKNNCINMCFKIDTSAPVVNTCNFSQTQSADLSFTHDGGTAIRKIKVKYRKEIPTWFASAYWDDNQATEVSPLEPVITGLDYGTRYQFQIELINSLGNSKKLSYAKSTPALPLDSVNYELIHTTGQKDKLKLTWQKPAQGNYVGVYIELRDTQTNEVVKSELYNDKDNRCEYTMTYLAYGMNCIAKVYSVTSNVLNDYTGRTLEPFVSSAFSTKPVKPANPEPVVYSDPNNIEGALGLYNIINTNGATGITKNKIYYKDASNDNNPWVYYGESTDGYNVYNEDGETIEEKHHCILEGLTPGTKYSLQIIPCNNDAEGDPYVIKNCVTLPGVVKNINITPEYYPHHQHGNTHKDYYNLIVNWDAPEGDYNYFQIEYYKGAYGSQNWELKDTEIVYKSSGLTSCTLEDLGEFSRYKIVISTVRVINNTSYVKTAAEKIAWTCPKNPLNLIKTVDDSGLKLKFDHSTYGAPYNISEAKLHVCYGATEEQALSGNYKTVLPISEKSYIIDSTRATNIVNQIGTPSCYFVIKTVLPADYDGAVFYSNVINSSLPPKKVTDPNVVSGKVNEWYVTSQSATLKWKNPAVCDNIKVYIETSSEKILIETIPKLSGIEQYTVDLSAFDSTYLYLGDYYKFLVRAEYDGLESDDVDFKVTPEFAAKNLNLSYTIQPQEDGDGYLLTLNWRKPSTYSYYSTNMAFSFQRYEISYTQDYSTTNYIGEKVTVDKNSGDISGGLEPTQNSNLKETTSTILNPGTYIIKLKTVTTEDHSTGASKYTAKVVTTDTIVITIPED